MAKHPKNYSGYADRLHGDRIKAIKEKQLFDEFMPLIKSIIDAGGSAQEILKKSAPFAAAVMACSLRDENSQVRLKAAERIVEQEVGKAVERSMHLNLDVAKLREQDLDAQIRRLMQTTGVKELANQLVGNTPALPPAPKQKRKPKKPKLIEEAVEVIDVGEDKSSE